MTAPRSEKPLKVMVAALTRRRPVMLTALIESWGAADLPPLTEVHFLIVENDDAPLSKTAVTEYGSLPNGAGLHYVLETEAGIPFGRNRAAKEALAMGADLLAFVDDDEVVAQDWLTEMIAAYRASDAVLLGGPLRVKPQIRSLPLVLRMMERSLDARYQRKEDRAARKADLTGTPGVTIVTNNWLGETGLFSDHGLWFDETMRHTGGTDSKFYAEVRQKGLPTGWVASAAVYEEIPTERLGLGYQFKRGRDQSSTNFHRKLASKASTRWSVLVTLPLKLIAALGLALAVPVTRGRTLLDLVRVLGWCAGRIDALFGRRSTLYTVTTGK